MTLKRAIYPGSFDPITNGHIDVIERAARLFDKVIVAIAHRNHKNPLLSIQKRVELARKASAHLPNVTVDCFGGLLVEYAVKQGGQVIVRGLRALSDFEFEFQLALMNRRLNESIETIFMMPRDRFTFLSSSIVKEIASLGGKIDGLVPAAVRDALNAVYSESDSESDSTSDSESDSAFRLIEKDKSSRIDGASY